jgi:hypothetical protein
LPFVRRPVRLGSQVPDLLAVEQLAEVAALDVDPGVVGHQPLRHDPVLGEGAECPLEEASGRCCSLVGMDLGVSESRVVVDDRVDVVDAVAPLAVLARAIAGQTVAGTREAGVLADVHMQQIAGARPLVAVGGLACRPRWPRVPARLSTFQTVEWQNPVAPATRRGPQPVLRRQAQITSASSGASFIGERRGRLERSSKHDSEPRASSFASHQRCHQRCAVAGDTLKQAAACFSVIPSATAHTSA